MENLNLTDPTEMGRFVFSGVDYFVFITMLSISAAVGIYFGFFAKGADTTDEYLMGGRKMKAIPIGISLVASQLSAISIMTLPGEMYLYGINFFFGVLTIIVIIPILCYIIIPVFYNNKISNCYEYLELRFNRETRELISVVFIGSIFAFLPLYNFLPSLAFAQITNFNIHLINTVVCSICVFYTLLGGIKAVVWTDAIQASIMVISILFIGIMALIKVGGLSKVLEYASDGGRLTPDFTFDLKTRMTFWNSAMNSMFATISYVGFNQSCVQRIVSLPTLGHAKRSLLIFGAGYLLIMFFNCFTGIIMYAFYHDCDPIKAGFVEKSDKLVPYFVQDIVGHLKGVPGLFISCVFSAALSTMSASMNALAGVIYMDYIKPRIKHTESRANFIMKGFVLFFGIYSIFGGIIVAKFTSVLQLLYTIVGVTFGAIFGVFTMGMLVPRAHGKAAVWSVISSVIIILIIVFGSYGKLVYQSLPTSVEGCSAHNLTIRTQLNSSVLQQFSSLENNKFDIFEISFYWYTVIGCAIVFLVGVPLSYLLPPGKYEKFDVKLLSPIVQPFIKYQLTQTEEFTDIKENKL